MRILSVSVEGVGGILDSTIDLPSSPVAALAGPNGTGKSKLLACVLSPWLGSIPAARLDRASVTVNFWIDAEEQHALAQLSTAVGWGDVSPPNEFSVITITDPLAGTQHRSDPYMPVLGEFARRPELLQRQPSLDVLFLPAERRLLPPGSRGIDLDQLSEAIAQQMTVTNRASAQNYGRLDDAEFEQFAKALCVASQLQDDPDDAAEQDVSRISWEVFVETVNGLIAPKRLLPLTKRHPETLRIITSEGSRHGVQDLSSGERQALIVISRILRAGAGHSLVMIDEPDAYLHPHLSRRLALALEQAVGDEGQLILATHSPAVLDTISPSSIIRMSHTTTPKLVTDEAERLEVYRDAGFRASALTQSDLLLVTEGESDANLLPLLLPDLARATVRSAQGRRQVIADVQRLLPYDLPVLGVIDRDVLAPDVPGDIASVMTVWPAADIESVFLADDVTLQVMLDRGFATNAYSTIETLRALLDELVLAQEANAVAETAQRLLRERVRFDWPTPKGNDPIGRLREAAAGMVTPTEDDLNECIEAAQRLWLESAADPWVIVRGKPIAGVFAARASNIKSGQSLLEAVARARPKFARTTNLETAVASALAAPGG